MSGLYKMSSSTEASLNKLLFGVEDESVSPAVSEVQTDTAGEFVLKQCVKCQCEQPLYQFSKDSTKKDGFATRCESCYRRYNQEGGLPKEGSKPSHL